VRRFTFILLVVALVALAPIAALAAVHAPRARLGDFFSAQDIARAQHYRGLTYVIAFLSLGLNLIVLAVIGLGRGSRALGSWSDRIARGRWWLQTLVLAAAVSVLPALIVLPAAIAAWNHERAFGLATNQLSRFLIDYAKATGFSVVAAAIVAILYIALARKLPRAWPYAIAFVGCALTFLTIFILPIIYEPAFSSFRPVDPGTRARVVAIAAREGVKVDKVLISLQSIRTTTENAYVSGLGATKRVVLYDTLLARLTPREVDLVVAHEIGHVKHNDILKGALLGSAGVIAGVFVIWWLLRRRRLLDMIGARDHADPAVIPFLALFIAVATLVTMPLQNFVSRHVEASADHAALVATNDPRGAVQLEADLARADLADLKPNGFVRWAFFTHPATMERIQAALDYEAQHK
jgi:Zn-dependent protease with chaperone function